MATPPDFISYGSSAFNVSTTPKSVSVTVNVGDLIVVESLGESGNGGATNTAPTGGSQTYNQLATLGTSSANGRAIAWGCTSTTASTFSISAVRPAVTTTILWGVQVWVWRNAGGFGAVGAPTVNSTSNLVTMTLTGPNSGLCMGSADWNAIDGTTRTRRTINSSTGVEDVYGRDSVTYTWYGQHYLDCGAAGSVSAGYSAPTGQATASIAVEILGTTATAYPYELLTPTPRFY